MASKIDVESGNPYRDSEGHFGDSPDKKLQDSFKALQGKTFVPKGKGGNEELVKAKAKEAKQKLVALRNGVKKDKQELSEPYGKLAEKDKNVYVEVKMLSIDNLRAGEGDDEADSAIKEAEKYGVLVIQTGDEGYQGDVPHQIFAKDEDALKSYLEDSLMMEPDDYKIKKVKKEQSFKAFNAPLTPDEQRQIDLATEQFKQSVQRVDNQILAMYVQAVQNGNYAEAERILQNAIESQQTNTLYFALLTIGVILLPLYARQRISALLRHFGLNTIFARTKTGEEAMKLQAKRGAQSHVKTIAKDIKNSLDDAIADEITNPVIEAQLKDKYEELIPLEGKKLTSKVVSNKEMYKFARDAVLAGDSRQTIINKLQQEFSEVGRRRANVIAGNEANRVFTMSQFDADQQFLAQNKLTDKAYKRLVSNTGHPEAICKYIIDKTAANPIPFKQDFVEFGKTITITDNGKTYKFTANYEKLQSGHIHVNCHCRYELLIKRDDGTFLNTYDGKILNELDFEEKKHKRGKDGKFAKKTGIVNVVDLSKINTVTDFNEMIDKAYWEGSLGHHNEATTEAVRAYQGHYYDAINIHARSQSLDDPLTIYGDDTTYGEAIKRISNAADVKLATDTTLYRGTEIPHHQLLDVGESLNARSFLSTSVDEKVGQTFKYKGGSMFVITAKKGQKVILPDYVTYGKRGRTMGEAEVLMPTDSVLTVTKIDGDTVYAELN